MPDLTRTYPLAICLKNTLGTVLLQKLEALLKPLLINFFQNFFQNMLYYVVILSPIFIAQKEGQPVMHVGPMEHLSLQIQH